MRKKITIIVCIIVLFAILFGISQVFLPFDNKTDNLEVKRGKDTFKYYYYENYTDGKTWYLYVNDDYTGYRVSPFEAWTDEEMRKHLSDEKLIKAILNEKKVRVYALPLIQYERKYEIMYSVDGEKFYCWNRDVLCVNNDKEAKKRLKELYKHISEDKLKKASEESWE